jgi:hypothetical protein
VDATPGEAARATLAERTARVRAIADEEFNPPEISFGADGVVDLSTRLSRLEDHSRRVDELAEMISHRFPWLDDDDQESNGPFISYYQGRTAVFGRPGEWVRHDLGARSQRDPTLILDLLVDLPLITTAEEGTDAVRGVRCERYGGRLDASQVDMWNGAPMEAPDRPLHIKAWVDPAGRLVRGAWRSVLVRRPRSPLALTPPKQPTWNTVDFYDFGVDLDIEMPADAHHLDEGSGSWLDVGRGVLDLWKRHAAWKRAHPDG